NQAQEYATSAACTPGTGQVELQDDHFLGLAPVAPDDVRAGPGRLARSTGPDHLLLALALAAQQAGPQDTSQVAGERGVAQQQAPCFFGCVPKKLLDTGPSAGGRLVWVWLFFASPDTKGKPRGRLPGLPGRAGRAVGTAPSRPPKAKGGQE